MATDASIVTAFFSGDLSKKTSGRALRFDPATPDHLYVGNTPVVWKRGNISLFLAHSRTLALNEADYVFGWLEARASFVQHYRHTLEGHTILPVLHMGHTQDNVDLINEVIERRLLNVVGRRSRETMHLSCVERIREAPDAYAKFFGLDHSPIESFEARVARLGIEARFASLVGRAIAA